MMKVLQLTATALLLLIASPTVVVTAQQYDQGYDDHQEYGQDNLYADYAARQQDKAVGGAGGAGGGGMAWGQILAGTTAGWLIGGKFHSSRKTKKLNAKHKQEQKAVYQQYYDDVYMLQEQNEQLATALEQMGVKLKR